MTKKELQEILRKHEDWLRAYIDGARAVLTRADLTLAVLRVEVLTGAVLQVADLTIV